MAAVGTPDTTGGGNSSLSTAGLALSIALPIAFVIFVLPWILRWAYLTVTHRPWSGCLQSDSPPHLRPPKHGRRVVYDIPMLPSSDEEGAGERITPGLQGVAGREVGLKGQEAYAPTNMGVRRPDRAHVPGGAPPGYKEQDGLPGYTEQR